MKKLFRLLLLPIFFILLFASLAINVPRANAASWGNQLYPFGSNTVDALTTGTDGKIWMASTSGHAAYWDGSSCTAVTNWPAGTSYDMYALTTGTDGKIWAAGESGRVAYLVGTTWTSVANWPAGTSYGIEALTTGTDGKIWAAGDYGYTAYWGGSSWVNTGVWPAGNSYINALTTGTDGRIWATGSDLCTAYWGGSSWVNVGQWPSNGYGGSGGALTVGTDGKIWVAGPVGQMAYWNGSSWVNVGQCPAGGSNIIALATGANGNIWASEGGYVYCFNTDNNSLALVPSPNGPTGQMLVNPTVSGYGGMLVQMQSSTDGANFTNIGVPGAGTLAMTVQANSVYFRAALQQQITRGRFQTVYSNTVTVPTISATPVVACATGIVSWDASRGRDYISLSWPTVANASGYNLYVFDGNTYQSVNIGNVTSWDSRSSKIFPFPSELAQNNSFSANLFHFDGSGMDFEDTPARLYQSTVGTGYDGYSNYWIAICAYNAWMQTNLYDGNVNKQPTLPAATDNTGPAGTPTALSTAGLNTTYSTNVNVTLQASDAQSGIYKVELSNDGASYANEYTATKNANNGTNVPIYNGAFSWNVTVGAGTKTIYVRITDGVGNQTVTTCAIALAQDTTPPTVTMSINNGATSTTSATVTLTFTAMDPVYQQSQLTIRLSNDGNSWTGWLAYATSMSWSITSYGGGSSAGVKTIYVQVANPAPCIGYATGSIGYTSTPLAGSVTISGGISGTWNGSPALFTNPNSPTFNLNFTGAKSMRFDKGIGVWGDWMPYTTSKVLYLPVLSGSVDVRVQVVDAVGVTADPQDFIVVVSAVPPVVQTLKGWNDATCTTTTSMVLELDATGSLPGQLKYRYQLGIGSWSPLTALTSNQITVTGLVGGANTINVGVDDAMGNEAQKALVVFKI